MARTIRQSDFEKKDFVPQDLIEKLTASVDLKESQSAQNSRKGFNPRPYLLKFENAIDQIRLLRNGVDEEISASISSSKTDEAKYKSQLSGFMTDLQKIMHDFRILDGGISKVSQTAIRIGDRLENVELQRQEILESEQLIEHFLRFNKDKQYRDIDNMFFAESGDDLYRAARLIIKLHEIGTDLTLPETQNARDCITNIANRIKKNLKFEFIRAYTAKREDNHREMKECATILDEFNDHEAFEEFLNLYLRDVDFNTYPSTSYDEIAKSIAQFTNDLSRVIETATKSIIRVFPKPELIIKDLINKVFYDQILKYLMNATQPILLGNQLGSMGISLSGGYDVNSNRETSEEKEPSISSKGTNRFTDILSIDMSGMGMAMGMGMGGGGGFMERSSNLRGGNIANMANIVNNNNINDTATTSNLNKLNPKELEEYLCIINIVYKYTNDLLQDLKIKISEIVFDLNKDDDDNEKREKLYSVRHILEEEKLLKIVFEQHQQNYLKFEVKHLKKGLKELIKQHVIEELKLEDDHLSDDDDEWRVTLDQQTSSSLNTPNNFDADSFDIAVSSSPLSRTPEEQPMDNTDNKRSNKPTNLLSAFKTRTPMGSGRKMTASQLMASTKSYSQRKLKKMKKMLPVSMSSKEFEEIVARLRRVLQFGISECVGTMKKKVSVSLKRCINISSSKDISENIHRVFLVYLDAVDLLFRKTLIPICKETLNRKHQTNKQQIEHWYFLEAVHHTNSALQLVEQCFINDVEPNISDTFEKAICKEDRNRVYHDFEVEILSGLRELLQIGLDIIRDIMTDKQNKSDFKPKADDMENLSVTKACNKACQFIDLFRAQSLKCLDGRNLDRFFLCLGTRLYYIVIQHFKKYHYNPTGAMILVLDAKLYQSTVKQFHIERINELFLTLVERTNLISIPSDSIVPYIEGDPKLSKIDKHELKMWLKLRTDYKPSKIESKLFD